MKIFKIIVLGCLLTTASWSQASGAPQKAHISVSGIAKIKVQTDTVNISFQSVVTEKDSEQAKRKVDIQVNNILTKLKQGGFDNKRLVRSDIQLRPEYDYIGQQRISIGVKATRNLSYKLDDTNKLNAFLEILVENEISNIGQISYALKDPSKWQLKARDMAVKDSISKAKSLAKSYKASLGKVYSINYQGNEQQPVLMRAMRSEQNVPSYQNNEITITERVNTTFLLKP